ncbi:Globin domain protein [Seminavis robusta]|uniref:Globin domain protein n=1 Tax=Seminavis robusta TaxID=568900 RepID=A0A9N8EYF0_9STRA|nr:Globin domain protein [Seminavis robusta]|eukprot:Sro1928_g306050.1 Globin domain protein (847) ;mRNA; r:16920-19565
MKAMAAAAAAVAASGDDLDLSNHEEPEETSMSSQGLDVSSSKEDSDDDSHSSDDVSIDLKTAKDDPPVKLKTSLKSSDDDSVDPAVNFKAKKSVSIDMEASMMGASSKKRTTNRRAHLVRTNSNVSVISASTSLPESIAYRVTVSWDLVKGHTEEVGVDFFLRLFDEHPQTMGLFKFGGVLDKEQQKGDKGSVPRSLAIHAKTVMETVGVCVAGLSHLPDLIPTLRSLGKMHGSIGVQAFHYDAVYKHLMEAIAEHVGPENFDEDTRAAWEIVYRSLTQVMKNPNNVLQMEPLEGWGTVATAACGYLTIVTPLQLTALTASNRRLDFLAHVFTAIAAIILAIDMSSHWIANQVRPKGYAPDLSKRSKLRQTLDHMLFPIKYRTIRFLRALQMDRWVQWQKMEAIVLLSFPLQYAGHFLLGTVGSAAVGVHWTYAFGLLRLVAATRVFHAATCAENNYLLRKRHIDNEELAAIRMAKLVTTMLLVIHINACLWCLVARMEMGNVVAATPFFPKAHEIYGAPGVKQLSVLNAYLHAVHWAWVNLAGIGDVESTPETTLECLSTLFVHMCGATLYTITTGNVVNILEGMSAKRNETGGDLAELGHFMQNCHVPEDIQKRILEGYMMKKLIGGKGTGNTILSEDTRAPKSPDAVTRLPRHLESEVSMYYRAEAIRRRDSAFSYCSHEFLVSFVSALTRPKIVLPEEDYVKEGQELPPRVALIVEGRMKVFVEGECVRYLEAGDLIGKHRLFMDSEDSHMEKVGLRADTTCTLMSGLVARSDIMNLKKRYARDFNLLKAYRHGTAQPMSDLSGIDLSASGRRSSFSNSFSGLARGSVLMAGSSRRSSITQG